MDMLESTSHRGIDEFGPGEDELDARMGVQWLQFSIMLEAKQLAALDPEHWIVRALEEAAAAQDQLRPDYNPSQLRLIL